MESFDGMVRTVIDLLMGSGIVGMLLFYRLKQRRESAATLTAEAKAAEAELDVNKAQIEHLSRQLIDSLADNAKVQDIVSKQRDRIVQLMRQLGELELKLMEEERRRKQAERRVCFADNCAERVAEAL